MVALVGRPNVGKSTLFNQLTRSRDALVADIPGLTRDRQYGLGRVGAQPFVVIDTGGLSGNTDGIDAPMAAQTLRAVAEADLVLLIVDARAGLTTGDQVIADSLRHLGTHILVVANKTDGLDPDIALAELYGLGLGAPVPIAAVHGRGIHGLVNEVFERLHETGALAPDNAEPEGKHVAGACDGADDEGVDHDDDAATARIGIAIVGRPNVGKSTLVNRLLGEERVVTFDEPGTTRDSIAIDFARQGRDYTLIDTAGVRRRARVHETIEKFSVVKTLQAIAAANVVILVLDARQEIADQDLHLLGLVVEHGRALVLAVNKWDNLEVDQKETIRRQLRLKLEFAHFAELLFISALHGSNIGLLLEACARAFDSATRKFSVSELTGLLEAAQHAHQPPMIAGRRIKLRYANQGGRNPPIIVIHGNQTERLPQSYKRYLENFFRERLSLRGTPLRLEFKTGDNPYAGRKNLLTPRQRRKRERMIHHVKRKS